MASSAAGASLAGRRVLVVEDEYLLADDMAQALRKLGAEVVGPVPTTDKALALLDSEPIDGAVLDINLRGQMAFPVADVLRERGVPFVFATGYDQATVPSAYDGVPRWEKPFNTQDLVRALPGIVRKT
jgi:DNA-binding response OmpR family regulator